MIKELIGAFAVCGMLAVPTTGVLASDEKVENTSVDEGIAALQESKLNKKLEKSGFSKEEYLIYEQLKQKKKEAKMNGEKLSPEDTQKLLELKAKKKAGEKNYKATKKLNKLKK